MHQLRELLGRAIENHLQQHSRTYGTDEWKPKMHYAMHLPHQLLRDEMALDCFVVARAHQLPKLIAAYGQPFGRRKRGVVAKGDLS